MMRLFIAAGAALIIGACATGGGSDAPGSSVAGFDGARLDAVLAAQPDEDKARYQYRHPKETLEFFGVAPGMTVVDTLPGNVWYSGILASYLGAQGEVIGADYAYDMWPLFTDFADEKFLTKRKTWVQDWLDGAAEWAPADGAKISAVTYAGAPDEMKGTADIVLMVRAFHHFNRFEDKGGYRTSALKFAMDVLKPGGVVGVVQHRAPETNSDKWSNGDAGYVKQSEVIAAFTAAGFEFLGSSEINADRTINRASLILFGACRRHLRQVATIRR
ncbi:MAG: hypothetical protein R3C42_02755 [Parvularculaceae bacterium]